MRHSSPFHIIMWENSNPKRHIDEEGEEGEEEERRRGGTKIVTGGGEIESEIVSWNSLIEIENVLYILYEFLT